MEEQASCLPASSPQSQNVYGAVQIVDLQVFFKTVSFCLVSEGWEMQFMLSLQASGYETCIILMIATFVMHRMSKPCNGQWFYISFYASMFKRFIFPVKFSYPSKAQTLLDRTADILVRNSKSFPSPTPHFRSSFTWEQFPSSSLTSSSKKISDICSFYLSCSHYSLIICLLFYGIHLCTSTLCFLGYKLLCVLHF